MKKVVLIVILSFILFACEKQETVKIEPKNKIEKIILACGYGDSEKTALKDAIQEAKFLGYGNLLSREKQLFDSVICVKKTIISKNIDEVGMWTLKVKASLTVKKDWNSQ